MHKDWHTIFSQAPGLAWDEDDSLTTPPELTNLVDLKIFLDLVQARRCLIKPFLSSKDYPAVEARELLPSFESDLYEYPDLPGFSLMVMDRPLRFFDEHFQFDILHAPGDNPDLSDDGICYLCDHIQEGNFQTMLSRLPKPYQANFRQRFQRRPLTDLAQYPALMDVLLQMDRGHVMARTQGGTYYLAGIFASLPSELDMELKRFGLRIKKFAPGDNALYERNRNFVYQFLMELYGYPIASERRTSAALFSRRLHKIGESFLIRVLGQTDRTITSLYSSPEAKAYPQIEKIALVRADSVDKDTLNLLDDHGFLLCRKRKVVILRVIYRQHRFDPRNLRQDRALSLIRQEVIHPLTARVMETNILRDTYSLTLQLNDIVRGEFVGRVKYRRNEIVEGTETHEKRLKFLHTWLTKHQRRIIGYSDEFYTGVAKVLDGYLLNPDLADEFGEIRTFHQEVWAAYSFIRQARNIQKIKDVATRNIRGRRLNYREMLDWIIELVGDLRFEIVHYFDSLIAHLLDELECVLNDSYLRNAYILPSEDDLTDYGRDVRRLYRRLIALLDEIKSIDRARAKASS
ncbi:MAG: hypothetical protein EOM25_01655 [Deltaproteobacteria bacterium]|nr:hypothetical protein [Deltaproteobacteria bacterium]